MKKLLFSVVAFATLLFAVSCQQENLEPVAGDGTVTYSVQMPGAIATKAAVGDALAADYELIYEVYRAGEIDDLSKEPLYEGIASFNGNVATVQLQFVKRQEYKVLFWAQADTLTLFNTTDLREVSMNSSWKGNDLATAVFAGTDSVTDCVSANQGKVTLVRPVSQINIATSNESLTVGGADANQTSKAITMSTVTVVVKGLHTVYNVYNKDVSEAVQNVAFNEAEISKLPTEFNSEYKYVAMNYVGFAPVDGTTVDVDFSFVTSEGTINHEVANVPIKANYRTNILGNLITEQNEYTVTIDNSWDGVELTCAATAEELQSLISKAESDLVITLTDDIEGNVTVVQKPGVKITIEGAGKKYNGVIKVHSNSNYYADAALTVKNVNFETSAASVNVIEALENGSERYSNNIAVENCTFTATGEAVNTSVAVQVKATRGVTVTGCTATDMHSLIQAQSCDTGDVKVVNCTVNGKNGVAFKQVKDATVEGTTITALEYGIRFDGNIDNYGIVVKNNNVTANQPLIVRKMTGKNNTIALEGENTLTTESEYQVVITNGSDDEAYVKPTGSYTLTGADAYTVYPPVPVAKVGNTEYFSMDEAVANWGHNTTLTLLKNVTLSNVITLKSTEYHILDLGTYTMTAAKTMDAISITAEGRSSASYALDIKADATNPGGITATSKAVVKTTGKSGVQDRPIIRFYNGVYNASNVISHSGSNGTKCPQFQFHGGVYNANLSANRALIQIYGGTFNGKFYISVDSSAYALISGGMFKYLDNLYGSALNSDKFTIGSSKGNFDRGVYVDDEGYFVVGGAVITEFGDQFAAKATNASKAGSYLPYSSAAEHGLYYTNAAAAIAKHGEANVVLK